MRFSGALFLLTQLIALTIAGAALANVHFPAVVQQTLGLARLPAEPNDPSSCTICHYSSSGGLGTARKPFAMFLKAHGLVDPDQDSLRKALTAAEGDMQGMAYIGALKAGRDPNGPSTLPPPPDYGCGARVTPREGSSVAAPLILAAVAFVARHRRRVCRRDSL